MSHFTMTRIALVGLAALVGADATFQAQPLKQGQKITLSSVSDAKFAMTVKMDGKEVGSMELPSKEDIACVVSVVAADATGPTAAKLVFGKCSKVMPSPLGAQEAEHACTEQTIEMKRGAAGWAAATELEKEAKEATGWICDSVLSAPLAGVLAGKTLKPGEVVDVPVDAAHRAIALYSSDAEMKSMKLTFDGERKEGGVDAAVFKVAATLVNPPSEQDPGEMTVELTGELAVAKSGLFVVAAKLTGKLAMHGEMDQGGQKMAMAGSGTSTWNYSAKVE